LFLFLLIINLIILYLDDFKLSFNNKIRYFQIVSLIFLFFLIIIIIFSSVNTYDFIFYAKDKIDLHGHVSIDKEGAKAIGQGLNTIGSQIGLGASIVGIGGAVGKCLAKSSMPPMQKASLVIGSGLITGLGHSMISSINRYNTSSINNVSKDNISTEVSKFMASSSDSPLETILFDIEAISYLCLGFAYI
jgi:hypothetical protein